MGEIVWGMPIRLAASRRRARRARLRLAAKRFGCVLFLLALASSVQAITVTFGDIEITPEPPPKGNSSHGYFEYVFHIVNTSKERSHIVSLSIPFDRSFVQGDSIRELRRTVQVGANEMVSVSLLQPDHPPVGGTDAAVAIDGRRQEREVPLKVNESIRLYHSSPYGRRHFAPPSGAEALILLGPGVKPLPMLAPVPVKAMRGMTGGPPAPPGKSGLPPHGLQFVTTDAWSTNWLAYSRYDGIIITAAELNALPEGIRTALWQYVETGGNLLVLARCDLHGLSAVSNTIQYKPGWFGMNAGFGTCRIIPDANYEAWDAKDLRDIMDSWSHNVSSWSERQRSTQEANQEFAVIDDLGIPVRGLFLLMFLFTLAIGPINVLLLSRLKRRIWLLWTTPAISLCTCLAVFAYMLLSEGWSGQLRIETLTLLDEATHRATTIGWTGVYSPLTPSDGLHFSCETEVIPQRFHEGGGGGARSCTIDWSQDQHFAAGWVEARVPALFKVRKSELRRERVALHRENDGRWSMVNGLGAPIRRFWYADAKGQIYATENIAAGARAILTPTELESLAVDVRVQRILDMASWMSLIKALTENPQRYLRPGIYLAEIDDSPFLEIALGNARTRKLHALVLGFGQQDEKKK